LKRNLRSILKKYNHIIKDIILFGSFVKGRDNPKDIDLAVIIKERDINLAQYIKKEIGIDKIHLDFITLDDVYTPLFLSLINEGYSIQKDDFLRNILKIKPMRLYAYDLKHLDRSKKTLFGLALKIALKKISGEKISTGAVLVPISQTGYFEDFLDIWGMKYKTKEWNVM